MRERRLVLCVANVPLGITPAYAGKTCRGLQQGQTNRDHPRVCGKDLSLGVFPVVFVGSPPRMRERPILRPDMSFKAGITPAYAGKTL